MMAMFGKPAVAASSHASASLAREALPGGPPQKKSRSESVDKDTSGEAPNKSCSDGAVGILVHQPAPTEDEGNTQKAPEESKLDLHEEHDKDGTPGEQPEVALIEEAEEGSDKHVPCEDAADNSVKEAQVASDGVGGCTEAAVPECEDVTEAHGMQMAEDNHGENAPAESTDATAAAPSTSGIPLEQESRPLTGGETATPSESGNPLNQEACPLTRGLSLCESQQPAVATEELSDFGSQATLAMEWVWHTLLEISLYSFDDGFGMPTDNELAAEDFNVAPPPSHCVGIAVGLGVLPSIVVWLFCLHGIVVWHLRIAFSLSASFFAWYFCKIG
jgi:hypothetical protein